MQKSPSPAADRPGQTRRVRTESKTNTTSLQRPKSHPPMCDGHAAPDTMALPIHYEFPYPPNPGRPQTPSIS